MPEAADFGTDYDVVPYDPPDELIPPPAQVIEVARRFGIQTEFDSALDLACGTGKGLIQLTRHVSGRVVGIDVSKSAYAQARERAPQAQIQCRNLLDLSPADLGTFSLICCIGLLYVVPHHITNHALHLIRHCLAPGGIALITYYAGSFHGLRAELHRWVRGRVTDHHNASAAIAKARDLLRNIGTAAERMPTPFGETFRRACHLTQNLKDDAFFHEVFNPHFRTLETSALAVYPLAFLDYLDPLPLRGATAEERALCAAIYEASVSDYTYAVFARVGT